MNDLNLEDKPELSQPVDEANDIINQFIEKLDKVKIDKWIIIYVYKDNSLLRLEKICCCWILWICTYFQFTSCSRMLKFFPSRRINCSSTILSWHDRLKIYIYVLLILIFNLAHVNHPYLLNFKRLIPLTVF